MHTLPGEACAGVRFLPWIPPAFKYNVLTMVAPLCDLQRQRPCIPRFEWTPRIAILSHPVRHTVLSIHTQSTSPSNRTGCPTTTNVTSCPTTSLRVIPLVRFPLHTQPRITPLVFSPSGMIGTSHRCDRSSDLLTSPARTNGNITGARSFRSLQTQLNRDLFNSVSGHSLPLHYPTTQVLTDLITAQLSVVLRQGYTDHPVWSYKRGERQGGATTSPSTTNFTQPDPSRDLQTRSRPRKVSGAQGHQVRCR